MVLITGISFHHKTCFFHRDVLLGIRSEAAVRLVVAGSILRKGETVIESVIFATW